VSSTRIWTWNLSMIWTMGIRALLLAATLLSKYTRNSFIFRTIFQYWFIDMQSHAYPLSNHLISLLTKYSNQSKLKFLLFYRSEFYIVIVVFHYNFRKKMSLLFKFLLLKELSLFHKLNFLIPISLQPDYVNHWYFEIRLFNLKELTVWKI